MTNLSKKQTKALGPRVKHCMYVETLDKIGFSDLDALENRVKAIAPERWALIVHDHDVRQDPGNAQPKPVDRHVHVMLQFANPRYITAIAKDLNTKPQQIEKGGTADNGFLYMVHRTKTSVDKYQYDPNNVKSNFDFVGFVEKKVKSWNKRTQATTTQKIDEVLDKLDSQDISYKEAMNALSGSEFGKAHSRLSAVWQRVKERESEKWAKEMRTKNQQIETYYLFGPAGTGKTKSALELAHKHYSDDEIFLAGSTRDPFQGYGTQGRFEKCIILDELRPGTMPYADLLKTIDPYIKGSVVTAGSRYSDKLIMAETIIITTPYSPGAFYHEQVVNQSADGFDQLQRRLSHCLYYTTSEIYELEAQSLPVRDISDYSALSVGSIPNRHSGANKAPKKKKSVLGEFK